MRLQNLQRQGIKPLICLFYDIRKALSWIINAFEFATDSRFGSVVSNVVVSSEFIFTNFF